MSYDIFLLILYVMFGLESGLLIYFIRWGLWRNQQLTLLLAEYYKSDLNNEED